MPPEPGHGLHSPSKQVPYPLPLGKERRKPAGNGSDKGSTVAQAAVINRARLTGTWRAAMILNEHIRHARACLFSLFFSPGAASACLAVQAGMSRGAV